MSVIRDQNSFWLALLWGTLTHSPNPHPDETGRVWTSNNLLVHIWVGNGYNHERKGTGRVSPSLPVVSPQIPNRPWRFDLADGMRQGCVSNLHHRWAPHRGFGRWCVAGGGEPRAGLAQCEVSATSSRVVLRHHHHARVDMRHRADTGDGAQQSLFQWDGHPQLVTEVAENEWMQFVFAITPPRSKSTSSSPL